ncbi:MAG: VanW family protein [Lachnospiraceae bacterium]|nr:VanW family protein [Lachnospiraceae bacterium]
MRYRIPIAAVLAGLLVLACSCGFSQMKAYASAAPVFGIGGSGEKGGEQAQTGTEIDVEIEVTEDSVIPEGVYINETPVGGMTIREAREQLVTAEEEIRSAVFTVELMDQTVSIPFEEVGLAFEDTTDILYDAAKIGRRGTLLERYKALKDLENDRIICTWSYDFDVQLLEEKVAALADTIYVEPIEATITRVDGAFVVTEDQTGVMMDTDATLELVRAAVADWSGESPSIEAVITITEPKYTYEALSTIQDIMADYVTPMGGDVSQGRGWNVVLGAQKMNGVVLLPGESYSAWERLQPFTVENGWQYATAFNQGGYVDDLGGGVCSLTTTLYNAIMYAELQVDRRYNHSMVINYARPGFDSTVNNDGSKDLVFTNNYDFPIYIEARAWAVNPDYGQCYFAIWGTRTAEFNSRDVSLYYEVIEQEDAVDNYVIDPELEPGTEVRMQSAYPYMVVNAYKKVEVNGVIVSDEYLHTDTYIRSDGIIHHNPINP